MPECSVPGGSAGADGAAADGGRGGRSGRTGAGRAGGRGGGRLPGTEALPMVPPEWSGSPGALALRDGLVSLERVISGNWAPPTAPAGRADSPRLRTRLRGRLLRLGELLAGGRIAWEYTLRLMLCTGVAAVLSEVIPLQRSYWLVLTVGIILKPDYGSVFARAVQRAIGTVVGAVLGAAILAIVPYGPWLLLPFGVLAALLPFARARNFGLVATFLTPLVVLLIDLLEPSGWRLAEDRLIDTVLASAVVLVVGYAPWPSAWQAHLPGQFAEAVRAVCGYLDEALVPPADEPAGRLPRPRPVRRRAARVAVAAAAGGVPRALQRAHGIPADHVRADRREPAGVGLVAGPGGPGRGDGRGDGDRGGARPGRDAALGRRGSPAHRRAARGRGRDRDRHAAAAGRAAAGRSAAWLGDGRGPFGAVDADPRRRGRRRGRVGHAAGVTGNIWAWGAIAGRPGASTTRPAEVCHAQCVQQEAVSREGGSEIRPRPASIRDVARLAGVSHQTVSRVLNGHPSIRDITKSRVLAAMDELQFRPSRAARMLSTQRSQTIGVLAAAVGSHYGPASSVSAVEDAARARGYYATVAHLASVAPGAITAAIEELLSQNVEGIVIVAPRTTVLSRLAALSMNVPIVAAQGEQSDAGGIPVVSINQETGVRMVLEYLIGRGHKRILHVAGPPDWNDAQSRLRAYQAELRAAGLPPAPPLFGDWTADSGYELGRALVSDTGPGDLPFTAVFSSNDQMALGLIHAFREAGLDVPRDVSSSASTTSRSPRTSGRR